MTKNLFTIIALTVAISASNPSAMADDLPARVTALEGQVTELNSRIQKLEGKGDKAWSCLANCAFYSYDDATKSIKQDGEPIQISSNAATSLEAWQNLQKTCEDERSSNKKDRAYIEKENSYERANWKTACQKN
jgi:hypothetical protein